MEEEGKERPADKSVTQANGRYVSFATLLVTYTFVFHLTIQQSLLA